MEGIGFQINLLIFTSQFYSAHPLFQILGTLSFFMVQTSGLFSKLHLQFIYNQYFYLNHFPIIKFISTFLKYFID
jgi:hypothetical protein